MTGGLKSYSLMSNLLFDVAQINDWNGYVGAGIGASLVDADISPPISVNDDDIGFAYQFIFGLERQISARNKIFVEYRYFEALDLDIGGVDVDYDSNSVFVGIQVLK